MARIVTVYDGTKRPFYPVDMSYIRWLKISEALSRMGHQVDIATNEPGLTSKYLPKKMGEGLRRIPLSRVKWDRYDAVKTLFHSGFETLRQNGGTSHPLIISKLGSVVGPRDMEGIYFYSKVRERLYSTQIEVDRTSEYVTLLSEPARRLWEDCFGTKDNILIVPGATDRIIPKPGRNPYSDDGKMRCLFSGYVYDEREQPEANIAIIEKLNALGRLLTNRGARLYMMGSGDVSRLDRDYVTYLGAVPYDSSWDYFHYADVGVVVSAGGFMHNNESTKIYHYLRAGLPVVSESGFPNDNVVVESKLGFVVRNGNMELMADRIAEATERDWDGEYAVDYILENHTWDKRAETYERRVLSEIS